jgi:hypothetical protein
VSRIKHAAHLPKCDAHFNRLGAHLTRVSLDFLVVSANRALGFRPSPQPDINVQVEADRLGSEYSASSAACFFVHSQIADLHVLDEALPKRSHGKSSFAK